MTIKQAEQEPIRLALIGAGIFAGDEHVPVLRALGDLYRVVAVCSRTRSSAEVVASLLPGKVEIHTDVATLLAREDIEALDIIVPIEVMPTVLEAALAAGKHIISEKPIAPNVAEGKRLLALHARHPGPLWMVAENWRYEPAFLKAAELVKANEIGKPLLFHWASHFHMAPDNEYYGTAWRRSGTFQGGYLLDAGVHRAAALRLILGEVAEVVVLEEQLQPDLPPVDTICTALRFECGAVGSYSMTVAVQPPWDRLLSIVGQKGSLQVERWEVLISQGEEARALPLADHADLPAIEAELTAFAVAIRQGTTYRNTPQEALQDVALVEAMLQSAQTGERVAPERFV